MVANLVSRHTSHHDDFVGQVWNVLNSEFRFWRESLIEVFPDFCHDGTKKNKNRGMAL